MYTNQRQINYRIGFLLSILVATLSGCYSSQTGGRAMPISLAKPAYAVDVFYENQTVARPYIELQPVKIEYELLLTDQQTTDKNRMVQRGNDQAQKEVLIDQLVLQAVGLGAHAIVNVKYKYYTTAVVNGFVMEGMAVRYQLVEN